VHGAAAFRRWIAHTLALAGQLTERLEAHPRFELLHRPQLSTVCFRHLADRDLDAHNAALAADAQRDGRIYIAPAVVDDVTCLRATFANFRTQPEDVDLLVSVLDELGRG
jgi:aromatic-L-amino-acid decarboxylase